VKYARVYFEDVKVGDALPPLVKGPLQQIQLTRYAGASLDFNPIHQDDEFARAAGMGGVFAHGMLSMGWVGQALTDWTGAGSVRKLGVRFAALVRLKDTVTCTGRVIAKSEKDDVRLVELEDGNNIVLNKNGTVSILAEDGRELENHTVVIGAVISVKDGAKVKKGETFVQWDPYNVPILSEKAGKVKFHDII